LSAVTAAARARGALALRLWRRVALHARGCRRCARAVGGRRAAESLRRAARGWRGAAGRARLGRTRMVLGLLRR
jgi:hypothetical protein